MAQRTFSKKNKIARSKASANRNAKLARTVSSGDKDSLIRELQIRQLELETQNQTLRTAQQELEASGRRYADLFEFAPVGYFTVNESGIIREANQTGCTLLGIDKEALLEKPFSFFVDPDHAHRFSLHLNSLFTRDKRAITEIRLKKKDGTVFLAQLQSTRVEDGEGRASSIRTAVNDVTEQRNFERLLKESEERYRTLSEKSPEAIAVQQRGKCLFINKAGLTLFAARDAAQVLGKDFLTFIHPDFQTATAERVRQVEETGRSVSLDDVKIVRLNGQEMDVDVLATPVAFGGMPAVQFIVQDVTARAMAEKALRFQAQVLCQVDDAVIVADNDGRITYWNRGAENLYEFAAADVLGSRIGEVNYHQWVDPDDERKSAEALRRNGYWRGEGIYFTNSGKKLYVESFVSVLKDETQAPIGLLSVIHDITGRKMLEQELRQSEERYRSLVESSPDVICVHQEGICVYINPAGQELFESGSSETVLGKRILDCIHPDFRDEIAGWLDRAGEEDGSGSSHELKMLKLNGKEVDVELTATSIVYNGRPATQVVIKDVTENRKTDLRLRLQATVLAQVKDAVVAVGRDGRVVFWNHAAERLYKMTAEEAIGKKREDIYQYRWLTAEQEAVARKEAESSGFLRGENIHVLKNGEEIYVESSVSVLLDWAGAPGGWLAVMRDVTERKVFEQKLTESEERYRSLVESSPDAIMVHQDRKLVFGNTATLRLLRVKELDKLVGQPSLDFVHPEYRDAVLRRLNDVERNGWPGPAIQLKIMRADETSVDVESVVMPIMFQGRPAMQIIAKDVTERKMFEEALLNSERLFRLMFESNPHPMWIYDTDTLNFLFVNDAAIAHYGYSAAEFRSMDLSQLRLPEDATVVFDNTAKIAAGLHDEGSWRHRKKDGTIIDVEIMSHNLKVDGKDARVVLAHDITARKKAEQALLESEKKYRDLVETSHDLIWSVDGSGMITFMNQACARIYGYEPEELINKSYYDLLAPDDRESAAESIVRSVRVQQTTLGLENKVVHKDGREFILSSNFKVHRDGNGVVVSVSGISQDVTERKQAEQAIREARDAALRERSRLQTILNTIPSGVFVSELPDAFVTLENEQYRNILGRDSELETKPAERLKALDARKSDGTPLAVGDAPYLRALYKGENVRDVEMTVTRPDGRIMTILVNAAPLRDANGSIIASVTAFNDITERKRAEDALKTAGIELELRVRERTAELAATIEALQAEIAERRRTAAERDKLVAAVEAAAEAVVVTDTTGIIQYVNPAFERITGYERKEALGADLHIIDSGQHDQAFFEEMRKTLHEQGVWKGRLINKKKDGSIYYEDCTYSLVRDRSGAIVNYVSIKHDVTEKLRLESIAETVDTMNNIGYVFSGVRHEIGNPVSSLLIIMTLLRKKYQSGAPEAIREYLDQAVAQVERIEYLLTSLKNFNMYENLQIAAIRMDVFLQKFLPLVSADLSKKGIAFDIQAVPETLAVTGDPRALQQALLNIVVNASDAVEKRAEPRIVLSVFKNGGMIKIRVSDNGPGIPDGRKKDLFKPFHTTKSQGTGLGLVITRKLISRMKGFIEIASSTDQGTIVDISLPEGSSERPVQ